MNTVEEIKISLAAKYLNVTPKTIYNWIEDGTLKKTRPGYVLKSDLEIAKNTKVQERINVSKRVALNVQRDRKGRFISNGNLLKWTIKINKK